jgi:ubiquinone/menaquinone biosynthesis C-methylase UbiE
LGSFVAEFGFKKADSLRKKKDLPGLNSLSVNKLIWENWDWSGKGEEWTISSEWKESVVRTFIDPHFTGCGSILEVGPGAGRWTEFLVPKAQRFVGVDISEACISECRKRFKAASGAEFFVGSGRDLKNIPSSSIDAIWSFDVFVHVNPDECRSYICEFHRVLKDGGLAVVQHGSIGGSRGGWRSNVTDQAVRDFMAESGLAIEKQVQSWMDAGVEHLAGLYSDTITIARKRREMHR